MRLINVTGNRSDYAVLTLTDDLGGDLSLATIRLGVSAVRGVPPADWFPPDVAEYPKAGTAVLSLLVDEAKAPPGVYRVWADVVDSPTSQPVEATNSSLRTV